MKILRTIIKEHDDTKISFKKLTCPICDKNKKRSKLC